MQLIKNNKNKLNKKWALTWIFLLIIVVVVVEKIFFDLIKVDVEFLSVRWFMVVVFFLGVENFLFGLDDWHSDVTLSIIDGELFSFRFRFDFRSVDEHDDSTIKGGRLLFVLCVFLFELTLCFPKHLIFLKLIKLYKKKQ